jgi:uncharacterized protein (TIGR03435 family)
MPLQFLISRAFNTFNNEMIVGMPPFASDRYDIVAKIPSGATLGQGDLDQVAPLLLSLLRERFQLAYHTEERPMTAYTLTAAKPKMKKADPESRTYCHNQAAPPGSPPGTRMLVCQNIAMGQFVDQLRNQGPGLNFPIGDGTGLEGGWDFSLTFSNRPMMAMALGGRGGGGTAGGGDASAVPTASDPVGGYTIFEAIEKQLGLKLEKQKRPMPVFVIDHMEQKPTAN